MDNGPSEKMLSKVWLRVYVAAISIGNTPGAAQFAAEEAVKRYRESLYKVIK